MKKVIVALLSLLLFENLNTINATETLSEKAKIYLVTCEPGNDIYARFGHTGIRVFDPKNDIDLVFHWGIFSFETPNFVGRFISGETDYQMGAFDTQLFLQEYITRKSTVHEQEINFTQEQKQEMWEEMLVNYKPENRKYRYNFIHDNCATRPYKMIIDQYGANIRFNYEFGIDTYRGIIDHYVPRYSWWNCGINIIIGSEADKMIGTLESTAFPLYTMNAIERCSFVSDTTKVDVVLSDDVLYQAPRKHLPNMWIMYAINLIFPAILLLIIILYYAKHKHYIPWITPIVLIVSGIAGLIISYLWFLSEHPLVKWNFNILWLNPINLVLGVWMLFRRRCIRSKSIIAMISLIIALSYSLVFILGIQETTGLIFAQFVIVISTLTSTILTYRATLKRIFTPVPAKLRKKKKDIISHTHIHHHHHTDKTE